MQAAAYNRTKNFLDNNTDRTDHGAINSELDKVAMSVNGLRENLALVQKDDGTLKDAIVDVDNLTPEAISTLQSPGPQGPQGPAGAQGVQGVQGVKGDVGASFIADIKDVATNKPLYNLQPKGFSFFAMDAGLLYFKLSDANGDWSTGLSFGKGDKGDTGATGPAGAQGPQGIQGLQGIQGIKGDKGNDGLITGVDVAMKTANLTGRTSISARLVISNGQLSILLVTA